MPPEKLDEWSEISVQPAYCADQWNGARDFLKHRLVNLLLEGNDLGCS